MDVIQIEIHFGKQPDVFVTLYSRFLRWLMNGCLAFNFVEVKPRNLTFSRLLSSEFNVKQSNTIHAFDAPRNLIYH